MDSSVLPDLWQLLASVLALPAFVALIKKYIPNRFHALLAPVIAVIVNIFYGMANGLDFWTALVQGLGLGFTASGVRDVYAKTLKNK